MGLPCINRVFQLARSTRRPADGGKRARLLAGFAIAAILTAMAASPGYACAGVTLAIELDSQAYAPGEPVDVTLLVSNRTAEPVRLTFRTSQRFDLVLEDEGGRETWRWSRGRVFLQVIGEEVLDAETGALRYHATFPAPQDPGTYTLRGRLTSTNRRLQASTTLLVR